MTRYLLDTNAVSDLLREPRGAVAERLRAVGEAAVCTSIVVAAELRYGAAKRASPRLTARLDALLGALEIAQLEPPADTIYGTLRTRLEQEGRPIGANDLLIAAHALALGCVLVTDNRREFDRIGDLRVENWQVENWRRA